MKVLVIGACGQLGAALCDAYSDKELYRADLDGDGVILNICDAAGIDAVLADVRPGLVINTAAAHNVPACEERPLWAFEVNAVGVRHLARSCATYGIRLVHISTDYVFGDGNGTPYTEADPPRPLNFYGMSKLVGEHFVREHCPQSFVVRTAAMYGHAPCRAKGGKNFVQLMLHLAHTQGEVRVVTDEFTTPTYADALARQIRLLAEKGSPGVYHATCDGACSWFEFAEAIFEETGTSVKLHPALSTEFPSTVRRPAYSVLENGRLKAQGIDIMPDWHAALRSYLEAQDL